MCFGGGGDKAAKEARKREEERQARIRAGMEKINKTFEQFDDSFFGGRRKAYLDFAMPQLDEQYGKAKEALTFSLARGPGLASSAAADKAADLRREFDRNRQSILDEGLNVENAARTDLENQRSDLVNQLNVTADPEAAAGAALARGQLMASQPTFSPLGNLFANTTAVLAQASEAERRRPGSTGVTLFGRSGGSSRVVS